MTEEEYKSKVSTAKDTVAKMIEFGEQNNIGAGELENDIETYAQYQSSRKTEFLKPTKKRKIEKKINR